MAFKPLTRNTPLKKEGELSVKTAEEEALDKLMTSTKLPDIIKTTEERIRIIFDDSGSMEAKVPNSAPAGVALTKRVSWANTYDQNLSRITLAQDATIDYMKNCKPRVTAIEIAPLNSPAENLTKNLPSLAAQVKTITPDGGTHLYEAIGKLVDDHGSKKYTRALIFTDGAATDRNYLTVQRPKLFTEVKEMKIPVDLIIIGDSSEATLSPEERELKGLIESTGGTFLICKDGNAFKEKMKYFAPLLRYMLPAIASKDERG